MKIHKRSEGGYLSQLEKSRPELFKTINQYRTRLAGLEGGEDLQKTFDTRANIQYQATRNMAAPERDAYIADVEKQFAQATDKQFDSLVKDLKSEKRFVPTYRFAADQTSPGPTTGYYRNLQKEIDEKQKFLDELQFTGTKTKTVPQYEMTTVSPMSGLPGAPPPTYKMVTELPKGATLRESQYGGKYYQVPMQNQSATTFAARNPNPTYRQVGTKKITEKFTRQAKAGDPEYDKAFGELSRLQTRHKYRNLYANQPARSTGTSIYSRLGMNQNSPQAASPVTSFTNPYASLAGSPMQVKEGGEIKGKGKAVRGFKFGGVK